MVHLKKKQFWFLAFLVVLMGGQVMAQTLTTADKAPGRIVACPMLAKLCPDGSSVSPTGPNCEFPPCPGENGGAPGDQGTVSGSGSAVSGSGVAVPGFVVSPGQAGGATPRIYNATPQLEDTAPETTPPDSNRAPLDKWLHNIQGADAGQLNELSNDSVAVLFPAYHFYTLRFRMYPVAREVPDPLKASNVFAVSSAGVVTHLTEDGQLQSFFLSTLAALPDENQQREALKAWLALVQELQQDAFFHFSDPEDSIIVTSTGSGRSIVGKILALQGGKGEIDATLSFDGDGRLLSADTKIQLMPGIRPICQATKLLDKDPIVRRMAEQDLLVMGRAAKPYLIEYRAKANPELRKQIDRVWDRIVKEGW